MIWCLFRRFRIPSLNLCSLSVSILTALLSGVWSLAHGIWNCVVKDLAAPWRRFATRCGTYCTTVIHLIVPPSFCGMSGLKNPRGGLPGHALFTCAGQLICGLASTKRTPGTGHTALTFLHTQSSIDGFSHQFHSDHFSLFSSVQNGSAHIVSRF